jgi:tetraacyldisaccharide 4'-kinase
MFTADHFREILSGRRCGWRAAALRGVLSCIEPFYGCGIHYRNRRYDRGLAAIQRVSVPVVSVGNITTGGTGKTPLVAWIASWLSERRRRVVLVSRGYGAQPGEPNDEALELAALLPDIPHLQNPDRVAAARQAIEAFGAQVILLDDAFQHRRLHRDLDIVLIDSLEPFGFDRLLPRGLLREPLSSLRRADVIAISRADLVPNEQRQAIARRIREHAPRALLVEIAHRPRALWSHEGASTDAGTLSDRRIAAFCGLGNPRGFRETLVRAGAEIADFRVFSDHFRYGPDDLKSLADWADQLDIDLVVCTMKDLVKLRVAALGRRPLHALTIGIEFLTERDAFESRLGAVIPRAE